MLPAHTFRGIMGASTTKEAPVSDDESTPPTPYRPPAQGEKKLDDKVCPDCITDPEYSCEGGLRPASEFRVITGKGAERYAGGQRLAAYCRYHEAKRARARRAVKKAAGEDIRPAPEVRAKGRKAANRARATKRRAERLKLDKAYLEHVRSLSTKRSRRFEAAHSEERRAYKARWYQEKVDREIAEGKRPPRGTPPRRRGPGKWTWLRPKHPPEDTDS